MRRVISLTWLDVMRFPVSARRTAESLARGEAAPTTTPSSNATRYWPARVSCPVTPRVPRAPRVIPHGRSVTEPRASTVISASPILADDEYYSCDDYNGDDEPDECWVAFGVSPPPRRGTWL